MPRLIDADELKKAIQENICQVMCDEPRGCSCCRVDDVWDVIYEQPTVDAVSVVRCKGCIYGEPNGQYGCKCYHYKLYETHDMSANDFCSKGKRREDGKID